MYRSYRGTISLLLTVSLLSAAVTGCQFLPNKAEENREEAADTSIEVSTANPDVRDVAIKSNFSATIEADSTVVVIPKAAGEVVEKYFEVGDHVIEGDLLFKIDNEGAKLQVDQAKAVVDSAKAGYTAQQATAASTKAQANETIAKISSNEAQLDMAVDSAYAQKRSAGDQFQSSMTAEDYYETEYYEAKDDLSDMKKKKKKLKKQSDDMEDLMNAYYAKLGAEGEEGAKNWLKSQGFDSEKELKDAYSGAASAYSAADSAVDQLENAIQSYDLQKRTNGYNTDSAEMNYYTAQENVALAEQNREIYRNFTKATTLFGVNASIVGADAGLVNSESNLRQAKVNLENAEMALDNYTVTAPVSGTITDIGISLHNMASSATAAYTIETDAKNKIVFYVAEGTVDSVRAGNDALVTKNGSEFAARIINVGNTLDPETGLFKVEAAMVDSSNTFINGSTVSIKTITRESRNAITVPGDAVYYDDEQAYVFVAEDSKAVRRDVETGISDDEGIVITKGLGKKDDVIVSWSSQLRDGAGIKVISAEKNSDSNASEGESHAVTKRISDPTEITAGEASTEISSEENGEDR